VPATVDVFELDNATDERRTVTLVIPRPSLVNLTEKKLRAEQDNAFSGQGATGRTGSRGIPIRHHERRRHGQPEDRRPDGHRRAQDGRRRD